MPLTSTKRAVAKRHKACGASEAGAYANRHPGALAKNFTRALAAEGRTARADCQGAPGATMTNTVSLTCKRSNEWKGLPRPELAA